LRPDMNVNWLARHMIDCGALRKTANTCRARVMR
jgi:hypothetical protein